MKKHRATYMMVCGVSVFVPVVLAIGSFLGFPGDALLGGIYWLLVACWTALYTYYGGKIYARNRGRQLRRRRRGRRKNKTRQLV